MCVYVCGGVGRGLSERGCLKAGIYLGRKKQKVWSRDVNRL